MTIEEIKELLEIFKDSGVGELELQRGENRLRLKRASVSHEYVVAAPQMPQMSDTASAPASPTGGSSSPVIEQRGTSGTAPARAPETDGVLVKSPIVGTYYDAPSPD